MNCHRGISVSGPADLCHVNGPSNRSVVERCERDLLISGQMDMHGTGRCIRVARAERLDEFVMRVRPTVVLMWVAVELSEATSAR